MTLLTSGRRLSYPPKKEPEPCLLHPQRRARELLRYPLSRCRASERVVTLILRFGATTAKGEGLTGERHASPIKQETSAYQCREMKTVDIVVEFLVSGTVGLLVIVLTCSILGYSVTLPAAVTEDSFSKAVSGVLALPGVYYFGIAIHHASWWLWRRLFHRRRFRQVFKSGTAGKAHQAMRNLARKAYSRGGRPLGNDPAWEAIVEWCRFAILKYGSDDARREYARQYHLYRVSYGALSVLIGAFIVAVLKCLVQPELWWFPLLLMGATLLLVHAAWHRAGRMWKSLCYSTYIAMK